MQGDSDFVLRHITGVPLCTTKFSYKNASREFAMGNLSTGITFPSNWAVLPEKLYKRDQSIYLNLYSVLRANNACGGGPIVYFNHAVHAATSPSTAAM